MKPDPELRHITDFISRQLRRDFDWVHANAGREGTGKSTLGIEICRMVDPSFCLDRIAFTPQEFYRTLLNAPRYSAVMFDEGGEGLYSRDSASRFNKILVKQMMMIRGRNLFILINIPDFTVLDKGLRSRRVLSLTETIAFPNPVTYDLERGLYDFFTADVLGSYYRDEFGRMFRPEPTFTGVFPSLQNDPIYIPYITKKDEVYVKRSKSSQKITEKELKAMEASD